MLDGINKVLSKSGYPNADAVMERGVLLPLHHGLTDEMFDRFHSVVDEFMNQYI